jgi:gamma-glutamyltranspeptidase/glutathione hydrolase
VVSPITARRWQEAQAFYPAFAEINRVFFPSGRAPRAGELFRCLDQAETLAAIADSRGETFYRGAIAERISACAGREGGNLTFDDLANHTADWVTPLAINYRGVRLHEMPPNGQGIAALIGLGILRHFDLRRYPVDSADSIHLQIEAMKKAFGEVFRHVADIDWMLKPPAELLAEESLAAHASAIRLDRTAEPEVNPTPGGGTVYLTTGDASGMMVSYIQSNYLGFGSGVVVPGTGIALQNRGLGFVLKEGHPNCIAGGKRPFHTIIPAFVTQDGRPLMSLGVMGAHMQPQGHLQMMARIFDYDQNPQAACDAPRWHLAADGSVQLESGFSAEVIESLRQRGQRVTTGHPTSLFGGGQMIYCLQDGYAAASDPRKDGQAVGF